MWRFITFCLSVVFSVLVNKFPNLFLIFSGIFKFPDFPWYFMIIFKFPDFSLQGFGFPTIFPDFPWSGDPACFNAFAIACENVTDLQDTKTCAQSCLVPMYWSQNCMYLWKITDQTNTDTWQIFGPTIIESIHRYILLKILFLTISVQKCILNLKQNNIYYGVLT